VLEWKWNKTIILNEITLRFRLKSPELVYKSTIKERKISNYQFGMITYESGVIVR